MPLQGPRAAALRILGRLDADHYAGADPYDALNASRVPSWAVSGKLGRQLVTQVVKRSPWDLRRVLGVRPAVSAYTLGHALTAQSRLSDDTLTMEMRHSAARTAELLGSLSLPGYSGHCWGYHFDVQTRFFFYAKTTPNVISTAFAAKGLAEATEAGLIDGREAVLGACDFILKDLPRVRDGRGQSFGYLPTSDIVVHNANMLAALVLTEGARLGGREHLIDEAVAAARFTVAHQRTDGSWPYSEQGDGRWVDGFHTGFVLEGLDAVMRATGDEVIGRALQNGLSYYIAHFFGPNGEPRYYADRAFPYDALSAAQAMEVLAQLSDRDERCREVLSQVVRWTLDHLVDDQGRVAYRVTRRGTDWREFPRWAGGPVCSALATVGRA